MEDANGRFHFVDVLPACSAGAGGGDLEIFFRNIELYLFIQLGHHFHTGKTRLPFVIGIEGRDPHQSMGALLVA